MKTDLLSPIAIQAVRLYQLLFRPLFHVLSFAFFGYYSHCKHQPTCSEYTIIQIRRHGTITGLKKGLLRIWSCR